MEISESPIDLIITLGGDGTILHASSLFRIGPVPPVLSFSMGTLGFLLPFSEFKVIRGSASCLLLSSEPIDIGSFKKALEDVINGNATVMERMRVACTFRDKNGEMSELPGSQGLRPF
jgi:NADH kinase